MAEKKPFWSNFVSVSPETDGIDTVSELKDDGVMPETAILPTVTITPAPVPQGQPRTALDWTLDEVFQAGKAEQGRNSAETVITLQTKLSAFPEAQQLAMIRGMDAVDDTWGEAGAIADAQNRINILAKYTELVDRDAQTRLNQINAELAEAQRALNAKVIDLDARIESLQDERLLTVEDKSKVEKASLEKVGLLAVKSTGVKQAVAETITKYQAVIKFFGV